MKKFIFLLNKKTFSLLTILILSLNIFAFAANSSAVIDNEKREKAISVLLNAGWELAQIEDLISDKELLDYADVITVNSSEKKYYKVTDTQTTELTESQCFYEINELKRDFITNLTTENSGISALSI